MVSFAAVVQAVVDGEPVFDAREVIVCHAAMAMYAWNRENLLYRGKDGCRSWKLEGVCSCNQTLASVFVVGRLLGFVCCGVLCAVCYVPVCPCVTLSSL